MQLPALNFLFGPKMLMVWFCLLNALNYVERGAISSNGINGKYENSTCEKTCDDRFSKECRDMCGFSGLQGEFNLTNGEVGLLATLFTAGLTVASPLSAHAVREVHPFMVIGIGQLVFTFGLLMCGFSTSFLWLVSFRTLVGVSEPSFMVVAPAVIDRIAPKATRATWLAVFMMFVSVGSGLGLLLGMIIEQAGWDWRWSFRIQAAINFPLSLLFLIARPTTFQWDGCKAPPPTEKSTLLETVKDLSDDESPPPQQSLKEEQKTDEGTLWGDVKQLLSLPRYIALLVAYSLMQVVGGVVLFWGPKSVRQEYDFDETDTFMGGIVLITGVTGSVLGGIMLDKLGGGFKSACYLSSALLFIGGTLFLCAWWVDYYQNHVTINLLFFFFGFLALSSFLAPVVSTLLRVTEPHLRPQSVALATFVFHIFGDVPSPWYTGVIQDHLLDWRYTYSIIYPTLHLSAFVFWLAPNLGGVEYRQMK